MVIAPSVEDLRRPCRATPAVCAVDPRPLELWGGGSGDLAAVARRRLSFALHTGYGGPEAISIVEER